MAASEAPVRSAERLRAAPAAGLAAALGLVVLYAAFDGGATALPAEARVAAAVAAAAALVAAAIAFGGAGHGSLRVAAPRSAWAGVGLLAGFAIWCGLSLEWSLAPDLAWRELNRAIAYALAAALALALGASLARAPERVALGYGAIATLVALYALAGKAVPGLGFDHTEDFSRLREPLGYWNALSLFCVLAVPAAVRAGARRPLALAALVALLVTIALTYSRGGFLALAVALAVTVALGPERLRAAACAGAGAAGALPALLVVLAREDLRTDGLPLAERTGDGLLFLAALLAGMALAVLLGSAIRRSTPSAGERWRRAGRPAALAAAGAVALAAATLPAIAPGFYGERIDEFTEVRFERQDDPARVLRTSSGNRWSWWNEAGGAWWDEPLAGHGAGSFPLVHLRYRDNELDVRQAHSVPLELLAETGLVGALLALGGAGLLALAAGRRALARPRDPWSGALAAGAAAWLVHMWFDWDWDIPALALALLVFLGVLAARPVPPEPAGRARTGSGPRAVALAGATAAACLIAVSAALPSVARDRTSQALATASGGELARAAALAEEASRLDPLAIDGLLAGATIEERRRRYGRAASLLAEAVERQPRNRTAWLTLARFEFLVGRIDNGIRLGDVARRLDPQSANGLRFLLTYGEAARNSASAGATPPR